MASHDLHPDHFYLYALHRGDAAAVNILFKRWYRSCSYYADRIVHDQSAAEDIVQEAWIRLLREMPRFQEPLALKSILYTIISWKANRYLEQQSARARRELKAERAHTPVPINPEQSLIAAEMISLLHSYARQLSPQCQTIFLLYYQEDLSFAEIAVRLGLAEATVRVQKARAIARLKKYFRLGLSVISLLYS